MLPGAEESCPIMQRLLAFTSLAFASFCSLGVVLMLSSCATSIQGRTNDSGNESVVDAGTPTTFDAVPSIDADTCPGDPCQLAPQCGCPSEACDLDVDQLPTGGVVCREVVAPGTEASACAALDECAAGLVCLGGHCRSYCNAQTSCPAGQCIVQPVYESMSGSFEPIPGTQVCSKNCSPEKSSNNGCPATPQFGCHFAFHDPDGIAENGDEFFYTDCTRAPASGGGNGADCTTLGDTGCQPGYECVNQGGDTICRQICLVPSGACTTGTCTAFAGDGLSVGAVEYGVCL